MIKLTYEASFVSIPERYDIVNNDKTKFKWSVFTIVYIFRMLERDKHELDMQKKYKEIEEEKALYSVSIS